MKTEFLLKQEFKTWLIESQKKSKGTATSYISYVTGVNKLFIISRKSSDKKLSFFKCLLELDNQHIECVEKVVMDLITELTIDNTDDVFNKPKKTIRNYITGLNRYLEFLIEQPFSVIENRTNRGVELIKNQIEEFEYSNANNVDLDENIIRLYSRMDLIRIFSLRIKTQYRIYENVFYPIRFINRVFSVTNNRPVFKGWLTDLLNSITICLGEDNETTFFEISSLTIRNGKTYISHKKTEKLAFTKLSDNKKTVPFNVKTLSKISIDHERSLFDIMNANITRLPIINQITEELKKHISGKISYQKLSKASHSDKLNGFLETINTENLLKELKLISSETRLQLMESSYNISKGKG
jgi:hypothetical protein